MSGRHEQARGGTSFWDFTQRLFRTKKGAVRRSEALHGLLYEKNRADAGELKTGQGCKANNTILSPTGIYTHFINGITAPTN